MSEIKLTTVCKFEKISVNQILREISFGDSVSAKSAIATHSAAQNNDFWEFLHFLKAEFYQINKIQSPKNGENRIFRASRFSKIVFT